MQYHRLHPDSKTDINNLQKILTAAPGYYLLLEGKLPGPDTAMEELKQLPPGKSESDKYFFGIQHAGEYIGCFDLIRDYPESKIGFIGLLLFAESEQSKSYGVNALKYIKSMASQWGCTRLRLVVVRKNRRAFKFWRREGFIELFRKPYARYSDDIIIMEYALAVE